VRVVLDTNVFVGACLGVGAASRAVAACLRGTVTPLMGTTLFNEYEAVLSRTRVFRRSRLDAREREALLDIFMARCEWVRIYYGWRPNLRDEGDNHLVELAVAGSARMIVTRNLRDLTAMELRFPQLRVCNPERFLQELSEWQH
jgi:putative PIN family toxin of toxin-antitoxin system